jgi:hypothetical protein
MIILIDLDDYDNGDFELGEIGYHDNIWQGMWFSQRPGKQKIMREW